MTRRGERAALATAVVAHYREVQRDLPWRRTRDPYAIWVSEIMCQQTRVATVIPYWERWMARFPTVATLAAAPLDDVLAAWAGLGYYSRARNLYKGAQAALARWDGALPRSAAELREVPGIGPYTAGAIASIAYGERAPLVDGNVARVLARVFALPLDIKSTAGGKALWARAGELMTALPAGHAPGDLNQGLMELGATVCTPTSPRCLLCPLSTHCEAARTGRQDELPVMPVRKKQSELPVLARTLAWIERAGEVVLVRRRPEGLFGGLWELPPAELVATWGVTLDGTAVAHHDQTLSHRRLRVTVVRASMPAGALAPLIDRAPLVDQQNSGYDAIACVRIVDAGQLGVAAATTAILTTYQDTPWTSIPPPSPCSPKASARSSKASGSSATTSPTTTSRTRRSGRRKASTS